MSTLLLLYVKLHEFLARNLGRLILPSEDTTSTGAALPVLPV